MTTNNQPMHSGNSLQSRCLTIQNAFDSHTCRPGIRGSGWSSEPKTWTCLEESVHVWPQWAMLYTDAEFCNTITIQNVWHPKKTNCSMRIGKCNNKHRQSTLTNQWRTTQLQPQQSLQWSISNLGHWPNLNNNSYPVQNSLINLSHQ